MQLHTIDHHYLGIPGAIASYVIIGSDGPVLIETGPASTLDQLRDGLKTIGVQLEDIRHALVTHIHLDHAGAAGHLAQHGTQIYVHQFGAKHLIDPSRLIDSATRIYGERMDSLWGTILPVPQNQVTSVHDGDVIEVGEVRLQAIETPGHARHHHAFALRLESHSTAAQDGASRHNPQEPSVNTHICLVGDIAGISIPGAPQPPDGDFVCMPTPPPEFDPAAWHASLDRLQAEDFSTVYLTHFGPCQHPAAHFQCVHRLIDEHVAFVRGGLESGLSRDDIVQSYVQWNRQKARASGVMDAQFAQHVSRNLVMSADGIMRHLNLQQQATAHPQART